ncbi:hypothetical protein [Methylobacterium sp. 77]|uniref:hypothetical protein n=1 Tax=Methylobacterium sp. 77 TaxID=1101192 RepID=UPI0012DEB9EE|nr:hypothetical protein [Methylobacterium sp. 77]
MPTPTVVTGTPAMMPAEAIAAVSAPAMVAVVMMVVMAPAILDRNDGGLSRFADERGCG